MILLWRVWSKWNTETSGNFLCGNIECYLIIGYLFLILHLWNQSYITTWTSYSKSRGERAVKRARPSCVSDQACPSIGEISRHRHRCYQSVWGCNPCFCCHTVEQRGIQGNLLWMSDVEFGRFWIVAGNNLLWGTC